MNRGHLGDGRTTTEWDELQKTIGAFRDADGALTVTEQSLTKLVDDAIEQHDPLAHKDLDELDELEDSIDDDVLESYRKKRIAELKEKAATEKYGAVAHIAAQDWKIEVTEHKGAFVVVLLWDRGIPAATQLEQIFRQLANKFRAVKFVQIKASDAIANYPPHLVPTVLVYRDSKVLHQWVGLEPYAGKETNAADVEWKLSECGVVRSEMDEPPRHSEDQRGLLRRY